MTVPWSLLTILSLVYHTESRCSPTSYYKNCWIRRYPGIFIDVAESQRRGAQLLKYYQEETALKCSRTCCLTRNFSCNLAVFHYDTIQENVNCFHLHCPTLESCILSHRGNVILYNITKGVDPDLLVFGKYFTSNVRVLPHFYTRGNASELFSSDKRQFNRPPLPASLSLTVAPPVTAPSSTTLNINTTPTVTTYPTTLTTTSKTTNPTATTSTTSSTPTATSPNTATQSSVHGTTLSPISSILSSVLGTHASPTSLPTPTTITHVPYTAKTTTAYPPTHRKRTTTPRAPTLLPTSKARLATASSPTSIPTPLSSVANMDDSNEQDPKDTEGYEARNDTEAAGGESGQGSHGEGESPNPGGSSPAWQVVAHALLVVTVTAVTMLLSCCCSVLLVVSWRGRRNRKGRYRTTWRGKGGSMRLIKYVIVRESS
ncbi:hypothetical protein UPYG_G00261260 [Umbra pygmaea]|uniref:MANSC domain-containing protein n=1 Tax=Umbra pygmaea TaxID=75934 RepID=A0ABD0WUR1_UMBPY